MTEHTLAAEPALIDIARQAAHAVSMAVAEGVIAADAPRALKVAALGFAFHTIAADILQHSPHPDEVQAVIDAYGRLIYRDGAKTSRD